MAVFIYGVLKYGKYTSVHICHQGLQELRLKNPSLFYAKKLRGFSMFI